VEVVDGGNANVQKLKRQPMVPLEDWAMACWIRLRRQLLSIKTGIENYERTKMGLLLLQKLELDPVSGEGAVGVERYCSNTDHCRGY